MKTAATCVGLTLVLALPAHAKTPPAERFDAIVRVQPGGDVDVTETLVFRDSGNDFTEFTRELNTRRTDGIQVLDVWMNGNRLTIGDGPGEVRVEGRGRLRIRWRFPATTQAPHTFVVHYVVHGAVRQDEGGDLLVWRAPGDQHRWPVASSTVEYRLPDRVNVTATVEGRRTGESTTVAGSDGVRVMTSNTRAHGWTDTTLIMPRGSILAEPPRWQLAQRRYAEHSSAWLGASALVLVLGLTVLFAIRQGYDAPRIERHPAPIVPSMPDALAPGLAGALAAGGRISLEHAAASVLAIADRGLIDVEAEKKGALGSRTYVLTRRRATEALERHEQAAVDAVFDDSDSITLSKARARLGRRFARFKREAMADLGEAGLIETDRQSTRRTFARAAGVMFALAAASLLALLLVIDAFGAWPLAIPAAFALGGICAVILYATSTPLSNEGVRRAELWRGYRTYLKSLTKPGAAGPAPAADARLPYAVALGLTGEWATYLKRHPSAAPAWFHASDGVAADHAAFIAAAGAGPPKHAH